MSMKFRNQKLHEALMERRGGSHEAKAGKHMKRAKQAKQDRRDIRDLMQFALGDKNV